MKYKKILKKQTKTFGGKIYHQAYRPQFMFFSSNKGDAQIDAHRFRTGNRLARTVKTPYGWSVFVRSKM